jgi:galactose-1-phosphate uridylyltransferase
MAKIKSEIRKSYLQNKYVIITPSRSERPRDIKEQTVIARTEKCPFCADNIQLMMTPRLSLPRQHVL